MSYQKILCSKLLLANDLGRGCSSGGVSHWYSVVYAHKESCIFSLTFAYSCGTILEVSAKKTIKKPRVLVSWNTGQRVHKPKKGTGSYQRKHIKKY